MNEKELEQKVESAATEEEAKKIVEIEYLRSLADILEERKKTQREIFDESQIDEFIDCECANCGQEYYSEYLMPNFKNTNEVIDPVDELCIPCYLKRFD
jgi:hypothetical protein